MINKNKNDKTQYFNLNIQICSLRPNRHLNITNIHPGINYGYNNSIYSIGSFKYEAINTDFSIPSLNNDVTDYHLELINNSMCMNLQEGGGGGFISIGFISTEHQTKCSIAGKKAFLLKLQTDPEFKNRFSKKIADANRRRITSGEKTWTNYDWTGKHHSEESIEKIKSTKAGTGIGEQNSQYGTCWITRDSENKKIKLSALSEWLELGWIKGRNTN